jgi:hypothetical protein
MLRMARYQEDHGSGRLNHTLPLHRSAVPMHITLDTKTLVQMFVDLTPDNNSSERILDSLGMGNKSALAASFVEHKDAIWSALFRTNRRIFHSTANYVFNYTIKTDGVSCCVVHMRRDLGNRAERRKRKRKREEERDCCEQYIDDIADARQYAGRRVVGIDPNMGNLLQSST